jgi:large subunit ribosomal protein L4e
MALQRPLVSVFSSEKKNEETKQIVMPDVFNAPIRVDVVNVMHNFLRLNKRHPFGVNRFAGHQTSAESWGTGRAVSRIPRVAGGGTHRAGQGAFGNMCRGGRMYAPLKVWRRWAHVVKKNERRYATVSAIAASSVTALVQARGHKVEHIHQVPLVVTDDVQSYQKTKQAIQFLKRVNAYDDVARVQNGRNHTAGKGKRRGRRFKLRRGPLVVFKNNNGLVQAFRNIQGVDVICVDRLDLLQLAPGGHVGRFIIWTESAFTALNEIFGSYDGSVQSKHNQTNGATYKLPRSVMLNTDVEKLIESEPIVNAIKINLKAPRRGVSKVNPLKKFNHMVALNPYALKAKRLSLLRARRAANGGGKTLRGKAAKKVVKKN